LRNKNAAQNIGGDGDGGILKRFAGNGLWIMIVLGCPHDLQTILAFQNRPKIIAKHSKSRGFQCQTSEAVYTAFEVSTGIESLRCYCSANYVLQIL